jgi:hypothetical protein
MRKPSELIVPDKDAIDRLVRQALRMLLQRDANLLQRDVNERAISHRFACYLQELLPNWDVDCEYNRDRDEAKRLGLPVGSVSTDSLEARTVYPDVVVHRRGTDHNLLVIEMKKAGNAQADNHDWQKLRAFTEQLGYRYALFVRISSRIATPGVDIIWLDERQPES